MMFFSTFCSKYNTLVLFGSLSSVMVLTGCSFLDTTKNQLSDTFGSQASGLIAQYGNLEQISTAMQNLENIVKTKDETIAQLQSRINQMEQAVQTINNLGTTSPGINGAPLPQNHQASNNGQGRIIESANDNIVTISSTKHTPNDPSTSATQTVLVFVNSNNKRTLARQETRFLCQPGKGQEVFMAKACR